MTQRPVVLFLCTHNAGRSLAARVLLDHYAQSRVDVRSAGSEEAGPEKARCGTKAKRSGRQTRHYELANDVARYPRLFTRDDGGDPTFGTPNGCELTRVIALGCVLREDTAKETPLSRP